MAVSIPKNSCTPCQGPRTILPGCLMKLSGECVYYSGSAIPSKGINPGDNFNVVVNKLAIGGGGTGTVTGAESGLHMQGTVARLGGTILETVAIQTSDPTRKVIFDGVVELNTGDFNDAYVILDVAGEGPALGIHSENDGINIVAQNNGINISGGIFGVNCIGETTGIISVGNTQNGGSFTGLRGGVNVAYGNNSTGGLSTDFGVKVTASGIGNYGTPLYLDIPNFGGTLQNMIYMRQSTNSVVTNGYGQSITFAYGQPGGGSTPQPINELRSTWSTVSSLTQTFAIWSPTVGNLTTLTKNFTLYNSGQLQLDKYTGTNFVGTPLNYLGVAAGGAVIQFPAPTFTNFYTTNGTLTNARTVTCNNFGVTWSGAGLFRIQNGNSTVGGIYDFNLSSNLMSFNATNSSNLILDPITGLTFERVSLPGNIVQSSFKVDSNGIHLFGVPIYTDNTTASAALAVGTVYRTPTGTLQIVY